MTDDLTPLRAFEAQLDCAVLTERQRLELHLLRSLDPIAAGIKIGAIRLGQAIAMQLAADPEDLQ